MFGVIFDRILTKGLGFDPRTSMHLRFDLRRLYTRLRHHRKKVWTGHEKLHLGSGPRKVNGWLNVDITDSDFDVDLIAPELPFISDQFSVIIAQQLFEHIEFDPVGLNFLRECRRILKPGGEIWLSCPDLEILCNAYVKDRCVEIDKGLRRFSPAWINEPTFPVQHRINLYFHQWGEHRNLFDFEMLHWALNYAGFRGIERKRDDDLPAAYPDFPRKTEEMDSVIVRAVK